MERREIEIFLTLAEELHFGRTAERLLVSQARVSQTIQKLERRIGAPVFDRTSRRVALTPIGTQLRDDLAPAQHQIDEGLARAVAAGRDVTGILRIGFEAPGVADLAAEVLDSYAGEGREVRIREAGFTDPFALLRSGGVDVLVTLLPVEVPDLTVGPILHIEPMVLAVTAGHPLASHATVTLNDLACDPVLRAARPAPPYWLDPPAPWCTPSAAPIRRGPTAATFQELLALVASGNGICPLAAHAVTYFSHPKIVFVPFSEGPPASWVLVWRKAGQTARVQAIAKITSRYQARRKQVNT